MHVKWNKLNLENQTNWASIEEFKYNETGSIVKGPKVG